MSGVTAVSSLGLKGERLLMLSMDDDKLELSGARRGVTF